MIKGRVGFIGLACLFAGGCNNAGQTVDLPMGLGDAAAQVNGQPISADSLKAFSRQFVQQPGSPVIPMDQLLKEVVNQELLRQEAVTKGLTNDAELLANMENTTRVIVSRFAAEKFKASINPTEEELRKLYLEQVVARQPTEYRARHILVASEDKARKLAEELTKGASFEILASKSSEDEATKDKGGELGWFLAGQMVPPFSSAVEQLGNGETTKLPVKSQYGWHIIQREESRQKAAPAFETVREQLNLQQREQKLRDHIASLRSGAKIEMYLKPAQEPTEKSQPPGSATQRNPDEELVDKKP